MKKNHKKRVFEALQEKLNWCPHCGQKPEVFQFDGCDTVYVACSCSTLRIEKAEEIEANLDAIALEWNNYGLNAKWNREVLERLDLASKEWLVVYETGEIVAIGNLENCYITACVFQEDEEYPNKSFAFFTLENDTPRFMSQDEIIEKLNLKTEANR